MRLTLIRRDPVQAKWLAKARGGNIHGDVEWDTAPACVFEDREVMLAAIKYAPYFLSRCSNELQHDADFVRAAVAQCGLALTYTTQAFRANKDIVLAAMRSGFAFEALFSADAHFLTDEAVVMAAARMDSSALQLVDMPLRRACWKQLRCEARMRPYRPACWRIWRGAVGSTLHKGRGQQACWRQLPCKTRMRPYRPAR